MSEMKEKIVLETAVRHVLINWINQTTDTEWVDIEPILWNLTSGSFGDFKGGDDLSPEDWTPEEFEKILRGILKRMKKEHPDEIHQSI
jgi:hypothetical protein